MPTAFAYAPAPQHAYPDHPEEPGRLHLLQPRLHSFGAQELDPHPAAREDVARVHNRELISGLEAACRRGAGIIDPAPTFITPASFEAALLAAGAAMECTRAVLRGDTSNAFAIVRPPGHHAEPNEAMGFCLFNNVAVAACDALETGGLGRVAIVDYDAHHGNGTQAAFAREPRVAYLSTHQWGIYPGTGWYNDLPDARGRVVNVPLPAGAGDEAMRAITEQVMTPCLRAFRPDIILVSAGFDAHWNDPLTMLGVSTAGFYEVSRRLVELAGELCRGRIVFVLEGGYDPANVANGAAAVFAALMGTVAPALEDRSPYAEPGSAFAQIEKVVGWQGFG